MSDPTIPNDSGHTTSTWMDVEVPSFDDAPVPEHTDVCVVGAGMAGLSVAYALAEQGVPVTVLDDGPIAGGESSRTTAHLSCALDDRFHTLEQRFGAAGARLAAESHAAAIDAIERNARELGIDCSFQRVDGFLFAPDAAALHRLDRELAAAQRAGLPVSRVAHAPLPFDTGPCVRFPQQAEFHPVAYMRGLAQAIIERGGSIHTGVHVAGIEAGEPLTVQLTRGSAVRARVVVDATNATITSMVKVPIRQSAYRTYVLAFDVPAGAVPHALYWDDADPYHYIRVALGPTGRELLIVGGEDHRTGQEDDSARRWTALEEWTRQRFPMAGAITARWSGQIMEPADGLAYIGKSPDLDHVYIVTGDSGNGLTHGAIAGLLLPDLMRGREHPWARIYAPDRSALRGLGTLVREAASSTVQYSDWVKPGDVPSIDDIAPGHGALVRRGVHLIAAFRDEAGTCHMRSAKCPHLGGVVHWNTAERTWDCPCHGSRFDEYGRVINGPAIGDLEPAEGLEDIDEQPKKTPHRAA